MLQTMISVPAQVQSRGRARFISKTSYNNKEDIEPSNYDGPHPFNASEAAHPTDKISTGSPFVVINGFPAASPYIFPSHQYLSTSTASPEVTQPMMPYQSNLPIWVAANQTPQFFPPNALYYMQHGAAPFGILAPGGGSLPLNSDTMEIAGDSNEMMTMRIISEEKTNAFSSYDDSDSTDIADSPPRSTGFMSSSRYVKILDMIFFQFLSLQDDADGRLILAGAEMEEEHREHRPREFMMMIVSLRSMIARMI
jgi:hypothetical protein